MDCPTGLHILASAISRPDHPWLFMWGLVKDDVYILPMPITLNNLRD
jgi:hypothetical protein